MVVCSFRWADEEDDVYDAVGLMFLDGWRLVTGWGDPWWADIPDDFRQLLDSDACVAPPLPPLPPGSPPRLPILPAALWEVAPPLGKLPSLPSSPSLSAPSKAAPAAMRPSARTGEVQALILCQVLMLVCTRFCNLDQAALKVTLLPAVAFFP